jgi:hypothetical protein
VAWTLAAAFCGPGVLRGETHELQRESGSTKWEYKVLNAADLFSSQNQAQAIRALRGNSNAVLDSAPVRAWCLENALQELGKQGWEFVGTGGADCFVLKRPSR